jgi:hypothetical protein
MSCPNSPDRCLTAARVTCHSLVPLTMWTQVMRSDSIRFEGAVLSCTVSCVREDDMCPQGCKGVSAPPVITISLNHTICHVRLRSVNDITEVISY